MAKLSGPDEAEYKGLQETVAMIDRILACSTASGATTSILVAVAEHARAKMGALEEKAARQEQERLEAESRAQAASLVARETELSKREQEQYARFLEKDYFTRTDFGALESFYSTAYDRLSEGGKDQMSQRVWGGVKRGEYQFTELPEVVKEKEAERLEQILRAGPSRPSSVWEVPEADRHDFIKARHEGQIEESYRVLNRETFGAALGSSESRKVDAVSAVAGREAEKSSVSKAVEHTPSEPEKPKITAGGDFDVADLGGFPDPLKNAQAQTQTASKVPHR